MAILGIDNSLAQRKARAKELGYTGDTNDSATIDIWLHEQVMEKLAENGGWSASTIRWRAEADRKRREAVIPMSLPLAHELRHFQR